MSQPFFVAEVFTGRSGKYVNIKDTVASFKEILEGKTDTLPEQAFFLAGTLDDVRENAAKLAGCDEAARRAVYNNRARLRSGVAREAFKLRAELVERSFALTLDRGGMRRAWLRGGENLKKRYLVHVAGYNLGLVMRLLVGAGTPREFLARAAAHLLALATADGAALVILVVATATEAAMLVVSVRARAGRLKPGFFNALVKNGEKRRKISVRCLSGWLSWH